MASNVEPSGKGHSLWIIPEKRIYDGAEKKIKEISKELKTPLFEPHVTLIGDVPGNEREVLDKTEQMMNSVKPFEMRIADLQQGSKYFKCIYFEIEKTKELVRYNRNAQEIFSGYPGGPYMPHMSLAYGQIPEAKRVGVMTENEVADLMKATFLPERVSLYSVEGPVAEWYKVDDFYI